MDIEELNKIQESVKLLLQKYPQYRNLNQRAQFIWKVWKEFYGISGFGISEKTWIELYQRANPETLSRAIRKVVEEHPELKGDEKSNDKRYEEANLFSEFYKNNGEST